MAYMTKHIGFRCNDCANRKCRKRFDSPREVRNACNCINWQKPRHMANPLMLVAMYRNPQGVNDVLNQFKIQIVEKKRYPYFSLIPPKGKKKHATKTKYYKRKRHIRNKGSKNGSR
jgi:hypothetical protein